MGYTENDIIKMCEDRFENIRDFYKGPCVNYTGKCSDTGEYYTEVIARYLCEHIDEFIKGLEKEQVTRESSYKVKGHDGEHGDTNRDEEEIAMDMFKYCENGGKYDYIGKIIDYQTPLKNTSNDKGLGKIDLLAHNNETNIMRILELKKPDSKETMLRCVLEGFTYLQIVDKEKLANNFGHEGAVVKASPFVFAGDESNPYREMKEEKPWLKKLMELLDSKPYYIEGDFPYNIVDEI